MDTEAATHLNPILEVAGLGVGYGQSEVISGLSLEVGQGRVVALLGLNGMGKTTLMKALIGILPVRHGCITLQGKELTQKAPFERVAEGLAYVPQGRMVFPGLTVEENITTGLPDGVRKIPEELYEFFPVLQQMGKRRAGNLSGGQQQQLVISRALASKPQVLLLDEPTEGIQPSIIKELAVSLRNIARAWSLSVLVAEQVLSFALAVADDVLIIDRGNIVHRAPRADLTEQTLARLLSIAASSTNRAA